MSQTVPDSRFRQFCSARPITLLVVGAVVALHGVVRWTITPEVGRDAAFRQWGLLQIQQSAEYPELSGPFDLWAGEWWRVPLGGLHHAGWWPLGLVSFAFLYLGGCLEPKLPKAVYGLFLLGAIFVTTIPRWLGGDSVPGWFMGNDPAIGLSGVVFAQFGCLLMLRRNDPELANRFGEGAILIGMTVGLGCLAISTIGLSSGVDNLAQLAGLPYGLLWGMVLSAPRIPRRIMIAALTLAHACLWSAFQGLIHPSENARYHWWLAETTDNRTEKQSAYEKALELDPRLPALWLELAELRFQTQGPREAWRTLLKGFEEHGDLGRVKPLSEEIWGAFSTKGERQDAWRDVERELPDLSGIFGHVLLSPQQMAVFFMERGEPLNAWQATMERLQGLSPTSNFSTEETAFAKSIWQKLDPGERAMALEILDQELDLDRRPWHLALIPNRDLISHYHDQGELLWAFEAVLKELRNDPAFQSDGKRIAAEIWRNLPTELRRQRARNMVDDRFGTEGLSWQIELDILSEATRHRYRLDQRVELSFEETDRGTSQPNDRILPLNPDDPESAALGISL